MFKSMTKYDIIRLCAFILIMLILVAAIVIEIATGGNDIESATPDEATMDEPVAETTLPETEPVEITECTTAPDSITEPSIPEITEVMHTVTEPVETTEPVKPTAPKVTTTSKPAKPSSTATPDTPSNGKMSETEMLACVIYQEVGGSKHCDECRRRVADVVLNRVSDSRFPNTIEDVLTAKNQYGRFYYTGIKWADRHTWPGEKKAVERAWRIAKEVMAGNHSDIYGKGYVWQAGFTQGTSGFWCCGHYFAKGKA